MVCLFIYFFNMFLASFFCDVVAELMPNPPLPSLGTGSITSRATGGATWNADLIN